MSEPLISLLHPTIRPYAWKAAAQDWHRNCDHPENVEYVLVTEKERFPSLADLGIPFEHQVAEHNKKEATLVQAFNYASEICHGKVLVTIADDFFSAPHWDTSLLNLLNGKLDNEAVVWANTDMISLDSHTIVFPILTRAYFERSGRYIFWPEYTAYYSDLEFHDVAKLNGVEIIDARNTLRFRHVRGGDEDYKKNAATGPASGALYHKRKAEGFPGRG